MSPFVTVAIVAAAGVMLVVQNLLMVRITAAVPTVIVTLVLNSAVGLVLLVSALAAREGLGVMASAWHSFKLWYLLPGLLGSIFVFASIVGYQRLGASVTIATVVASQLIAGLIADKVGAGHGGTRIDPSALLGAVLLIAGAVLVGRGRG